MRFQFTEYQSSSTCTAQRLLENSSSLLETIARTDSLLLLNLPRLINRQRNLIPTLPWQHMAKQQLG